METESDAHLIRYLLGELSDAEAEHLDERSVMDEAFAMRLRLLEDDLVDRYARGEMVEVSTERFDRARAASAHFQEKVVFARALHSLGAASNRLSISSDPVASRQGFWWRALAAAAVLLVAASGYLGLRTLRLRDEIVRLDARRAAAEHQIVQLHQQLEQARAVPSPGTPTVPTFTLQPPHRGPGQEITVISVPHRAEQLTLRLVVESGDYAGFWAALTHVATGRIVWRTPDLASESSASNRLMTFELPTKVLETQRYSVDLVGLSSDTRAGELVAQYPLRIVLE